MCTVFRQAPLFLVGALAVGCLNAKEVASPSPPQKPAASESPSASGMKIYIDPATGQWSSTPVTEQQKREAAAAVDTFDPASVETINHADGSIEYRNSGLVDYIVATRASDGTLQVTCSQHGLEPGHAPVTTTTQTGGRDVR